MALADRWMTTPNEEIGSSTAERIDVQIIGYVQTSRPSIQFPPNSAVEVAENHRLMDGPVRNERTENSPAVPRSDIAV